MGPRSIERPFLHDVSIVSEDVQYCGTYIYDQGVARVG